jgi:hypothetical protein
MIHLMGVQKDSAPVGARGKPAKGERNPSRVGLTQPAVKAQLM